MTLRQLGGGRGWGIYRRGPKAPVGAQQPVPNNRHMHRLKLQTGAFVVGTWRHRVMAKPGAIVRSLGTGWCHQPVAKEQGGIGTGWLHQPVPKGKKMAPSFAMTRCRHVPTTKAPVGNFNRSLSLLFGISCLSPTGAFGPRL